jgi:hypothetical protein
MISFLAQGLTYQTNNNVNPAFPLMFFLTIMCVGLVIGIGIQAVVAWLVSDSLSKVPPEYRQNITPGQVWLLLIPLFGIVWNFFVYQRIPDSFRAYFESTGRPQPGDYGKQLGLWYSISVCCCIVPCVNYIAGPAALVLLIILIVKFVGYKNLIVSGGGMGFPVNPPYQPPQQ